MKNEVKDINVNIELCENINLCLYGHSHFDQH